MEQLGCTSVPRVQPGPAAGGYVSAIRAGSFGY